MSLQYMQHTPLCSVYVYTVRAKDMAARSCYGFMFAILLATSILGMILFAIATSDGFVANYFASSTFLQIACVLFFPWLLRRAITDYGAKSLAKEYQDKLAAKRADATAPRNGKSLSAKEVEDGERTTTNMAAYIHDTFVIEMTLVVIGVFVFFDCLAAGSNSDYHLAIILFSLVCPLGFYWLYKEHNLLSHVYHNIKAHGTSK